MTTTSSPNALTNDPQASALWEKLRRFSFDRGTGPRTFAARLAQEQGWSESFAALAIEEYRRFLLLFALDKRSRADVPDASSSVRIVPSAVVDKVWHLHLLYTQSYWEDLCRDILAGPLHHLPADGSSGEAPALGAVYAETLAAYRRTFGHSAPSLIWPGAESPGNPPRAALHAGAGSTRAFAGAAVVVGSGSLVALILVFCHVMPPVFLFLALVISFLVLGLVNGQSAVRRRSGGDAGGGGYLGDASGGGADTPHHDGGHHGGGPHDAGGHSHSCGGGGHSCGGHGCGGHGCGGSSCGGGGH